MLTPDVEPRLEAPAAEPLAIAAKESAAAWWRPWLSTPALLGISFLLFFIGRATNVENASRLVAATVALAGAVLFGVTVVVALFRAMFGIFDLGREMHAGAAEHVGVSVLRIVGNLLVTGFGMLVAYDSLVVFARG